MLFIPVGISRQAELRTLDYSKAAGQRLASMNEWEASEAYHLP